MKVIKENIMKAYKATYNMKCMAITYEVGKTYTFNGKLIMCEKGFHFCLNAVDTLKYYSFTPEFQLLEIDVLSELITNEDKSITDKFKVIRVIPQKERDELLNITTDSNNNKIKEVYSNGETYTCEYDSNNNLIKEVYPNGKTLTWEYDSNNNKIKQVNPNGKTSTCEYDSNNNLIKKFILMVKLILANMIQTII